MFFRNDTDMQWPGLPPMARPVAQGTQPTNTQAIAGTQASLGVPTPSAAPATSSMLGRLGVPTPQQVGQSIKQTFQHPFAGLQTPQQVGRNIAQTAQHPFAGLPSMKMRPNYGGQR